MSKEHNIDNIEIANTDKYLVNNNKIVMVMEDIENIIVDDTNIKKSFPNNWKYRVLLRRQHKDYRIR